MICPGCRATVETTGGSCPHCGAPVTRFGVGAVLDDRYEILALLGKGGMGEVYKAVDRELDEVVAVKVLRSELTSAEEGVRRFRAETRLARKVRHPNVCAIHEFGHEGRNFYLAMEFVEGTDLQKLARTGTGLPQDEAFDVARQVLAALGAIHQVGIVHRDLKTSNIMLDPHGRVRVMDFGIAKQVGPDAGEGLTQAGNVLGTPEYMSPEQLQGEPLDARSDLYAMGVILFELFTGDVPFRSTTPLTTALKHLQEPPPLEGPRARRLPTAALPVLRRALAKARNERFGSAEEMAEALVAAHNEWRSSPSGAQARMNPAAVVPSATTILGRSAPSKSDSDFEEDLASAGEEPFEDGLSGEPAPVEKAPGGPGDDFEEDYS